MHLWNPPFCGDIDMRIASDGTWFYNGSPIGRLPLVQLFASILRRDEDRYVLVTPIERVGIKVDDAPFLGVELIRGDASGGPSLTFRTNVEDYVTVDKEHPLRFERGAGGAEALCPGARRPLGAGEAGAVLRPGGARRDARLAGRELVRRLVRRDVLSHDEGGGAGGSLSDSSAPLFSIEDLRARARAHLALELSAEALDPAFAAVHGDHVLNAAAPAEGARPAAVLAPIVARPEGATVLLTLRASNMRNHSGQIAFPGGKIDAGETPAAAALREAEEEIGLTPRFVEPVGWLDPYLTGTGYRIMPLVAIVDPAFTLAINADEVDEVFSSRSAS